ncbi:hypothetical protein MCHLDSM_03850 [Mycolicibacterium chlorophenolicum]|uniref:Uncharacterized protein n=1 Tax=Mycolicibacterium chlorophenolicum TaxID=37916 RepID=A0A0J6VP78_9MYCO|nr:hypothetical protein MCHLDSM_03850 [Mycolicibacterium chlorophenolicum]
MAESSRYQGSDGSWMFVMVVLMSCRSRLLQIWYSTVIRWFSCPSGCYATVKQ